MTIIDVNVGVGVGDGKMARQEPPLVWERSTFEFT